VLGWNTFFVGVNQSFNQSSSYQFSNQTYQVNRPVVFSNSFISNVGGTTNGLYPLQGYVPKLAMSNGTATLVGISAANNNSAALGFNNVGGAGSPLNTGFVRLFGGASTTFDNVANWKIPSGGSLSIGGVQVCQSNGTNCPGGLKTSQGVQTLVSGSMTVSTASACTPSSNCVYHFDHCNRVGASIGMLILEAVSVGTSFTVNAVNPSGGTIQDADASSVCWRIN
jgi:hypothetical protein